MWCPVTWAEVAELTDYLSHCDPHSQVQMNEIREEGPRSVEQVLDKEERQDRLWACDSLLLLVLLISPLHIYSKYFSCVMSAIFKMFLKKNGSIMVSGKQHGEASIQFQLMNLIKRSVTTLVLELFLGAIRDVNSQGPSGQHPAGAVWLFSHIHLWAHVMYLMLVNYHVSLDPTEKLALEALSPHPLPHFRLKVFVSKHPPKSLIWR